MFVADWDNQRVDEFSSSGAFVRAWGWGVADGGSKLETCTSSCQTGISGGGAGQLENPSGIAVDGSGDVFVTSDNDRVQEFSSSGTFIRTIGSPGNGAGQLVGPFGVAVDGSGNVFVADQGEYRVDEFSSSGTFIKAWGWGVLDGQSKFEICTATCQSGLEGGGAGEFFDPYGIAVNSSGDVFVGDCGCTSPDFGNYRIDEFSASSGAFIKAWGWGVADGGDRLETCTTTCRGGMAGNNAGQLDGDGAIAIDGSGNLLVTHGGRIDEFSPSGTFLDAWGFGVLDGRSQLETCTTTCQGALGAGGGAGAGANDGSWGVAVDGSGDVFEGDQGFNRIDEFHVTPGGAPVNTSRPVITGTPKRGKRLSCSKGKWSNNPTSFAYQWQRNGTPLAGATGHTHLLDRLDEGTTMVCVVTAKNATGSASADSKSVKVAIPVVARCPAAKGKMTGTMIGQIRLGMTRARARHVYRHNSNHGKHYEDFFCLTPIGIRVGYGSPLLLKTLASGEQAKVKGRVVWASTANPHYALDGVRPGESISTAARVLGTEAPFHIGLNYWYLARKAGYTAVLKVRGNVVEEIGIATNTLTTTRQDQSVLMHSFY